MARISEIMVKQLPKRRILAVRKTIAFFTEYANFMEITVNSILSMIEETGAFPGGGPIMVVELPIRTIATAIERGPYEKQDPTLEELIKWIPENGFEIDGGIYYHYLNNEEQPKIEYLTQMNIPVKKANLS